MIEPALQMLAGKIAAVDFDGVLHHYTGWNGEEPKGKPILGAHRGLLELQDAGYRVVVHSTRSPGEILPWLEHYSMRRYVDHVTRIKPPAEVLFDDRARHVPSNTDWGLFTAVRSYIGRPIPPTEHHPPADLGGVPRQGGALSHAEA